LSDVSIDALWKGETARRKRLIKLAILVFLAVFVALGLVLFYLTQPLFLRAGTRTQPSVDPARLEAHVRTLCEVFSPRDFEHHENLEEAGRYIRDQFERSKATVSDQPFQVNGKTYRNIVAAFGPETADMIIVGAHYDSFGSGAGADDNASGVAGLLELANLLGKHPPAIRTELVAYTLEEPPFFRTATMGSAIHAASLKQRNVNVRAMLSLEMIGYFSDAANSQRLPLGVLSLIYPTTGNFIAIVGSVGEGMLVRKVKHAMSGASALPVYSINAPAIIAGVDFSDHLSYRNNGYPALMITDTAFYRNSAYHTNGDTADRLDYRRMGMVVEQVYAATVALAN
jgi:hypothetical protein